MSTPSCSTDASLPCAHVPPTSPSSAKDPQVLASENAALRAEVDCLRARLQQHEAKGAALATSAPYSDEKEDADGSVTIVVLGASGDLAVKKTFPALFSLFRHRLLPQHFQIVGFARSSLQHQQFIEKISAKFKKDHAGEAAEFLKHCWYHSGQYDSVEDFAKLNKELIQKESSFPTSRHHRVFYMAIPPDAFVPSATSIHAAAKTADGWNRIIVEKPFGRDSASSAALGQALSRLFDEDEIYRIDHYLGKEMVQNLMVLRFANRVFEPLWQRDHVNCVLITFKEDFGTQGRGGYFDNYGIIRDVMQNHLLQMLSIIAMEPPVTLQAEDVRDEKVKLLRAITPLTLDDIVIGQYGADPRGREPAYTGDPGVPDDSTTPTFACANVRINNTRWMGTPFIMKCGKALNERKAEIRIQFKHPVNNLFDDLSPNELVLRVGPDEAVYLKMTSKQPGLDGGNRHTELDLTYKQKFRAEVEDAPDAYERLILDVLRGDHNLFVRADELAAAWKIFTPILHKLEQEKIKPIQYDYGSRGPVEADEMVSKLGYIRTTKYSWEPDEPPRSHL